jgi:hypothetical protein
MSVSALKDNSLLIDQIRSGFQRGKWYADDQSDERYGMKSSISNKTSREQKSTFVSEKLNDQTNFAAYNFRLENGVPLWKSEKTERNYTDPRKKQTIEVEDQETGELLESELLVEDKYEEDRRGKGFYVNIGNSSTIKKETKSMGELFQEKINRIYNIGYTRDNGTLVNLIY